MRKLDWHVPYRIRVYLLIWVVCYVTTLADRQDFNYSGSDPEEEETTQAGEPSSIIQAPAGDTLRRNFMQIQVGV